MSVSKERIGVMGGTFNPIHEGHLAMARAAMRSAKLDRVLFLPDSVPPHKKDIAPAEDRWRMTVAAVAGEKDFEPCRMELDREGTTYTCDTLLALRAQEPKAELFYLIGTDTLLQLKNWSRYEQVLTLCTFIVCARAVEGVSAAEVDAERRRLIGLGGRFLSAEMEPVDVSSTALREAIQRDEPTPLLSPAVREYCGARGLYGAAPRVPRAEKWLAKLFADLTPRRFAHTLGVAYSARALARNHGLDLEKAEIAALLHDCAKCLPLREMQEIAVRNNVTQDREILESGALLHAPVGAWLAEHAYGVTDPEILHAIACHTTGCPGMSRFDMAVYLADKIEPGRPAYPALTRVRMLAPLSLEKAMVYSIERTVEYERGKGHALHPQSLETLEWLKSQPENMS